jgi:hypothetical protein
LSGQNTRFPTPKTAEQIPYKVLDASGQCLAYVYGRAKADADIAKVLTMDEARRIAANIAKLPTLVGISPLAK